MIKDCEITQDKRYTSNSMSDIRPKNSPETVGLSSQEKYQAKKTKLVEFEIITSETSKEQQKEFKYRIHLQSIDLTIGFKENPNPFPDGWEST